MEGAELEVVYELRYRGQAFELPVPGRREPDPAQLAEDFAREHEARYGYRDPEGELELVTIRVAAVEPGPEPRPRRPAAGGWREGERDAPASAASGSTTRVLRGEPAAGFAAGGPVRVRAARGDAGAAARAGAPSVDAGRARSTRRAGGGR